VSKLPSTAITAEVVAAQKALAPALRRLTKILVADFTKLPVGQAADLLYDLKQLSPQLATVTAPFEDALKPVIKSLEDYFIDSLEVGESSGTQGTYSRIQITSSSVPTIKPEDWQKFYEWVAKTKQWELLTHKVSTEAVRERWDQKKQVKFVTPYNVKKVSCTKLSGKRGGR
jgi:hypothetical protein